MRIRIAVIMVVALLLLAGCSAGTDTGKPNDRPGVVAKLQEIDLIKEGIQLSGYNYDMALSPDGKKVVFSGYNYDQNTHDLVYKMVIADLVAGKTKVIDDVGSVLTWFEDGQRVLYVNDGSIGILNTDTGEKQIIENMRTYAALSPDNKKVAYTLRGKIYSWDTEARPLSEAGLWVYDIASGEKKQLTNRADDWYPVWYPDSKQLFYFSDLGVELGDGARHLQGMASISLEAGEPQVILPKQDGKFRSAQWLVPGKSMYVQGGWDDGYTYNILNLDHEIFRVVGNDSDVYSPSFVAVDSANAQLIKSGQGRVAIYDDKGNNLTEYTLPEEQQNFNYTVSPGGDKMAFVQGEFGLGNAETPGNLVKVSSILGESTKTLTTEYKYYYSILWDREGKNIIALQAEQSENGEWLSAIRILPVE